MKVCPYCGWDVPDYNKWCPKCGALVSGEKIGFLATIFGFLKKKSKISESVGRDIVMNKISDSSKVNDSTKIGDSAKVINSVKTSDSSKKKEIERSSVINSNGLTPRRTIQNQYIVLDIETTGFSRKNDRIIEIAADKYCNGSLVEQYHTYVNPEFPIYPNIAKLTGITNETLKDAPKIHQVKNGFLSFIRATTLVGHNIITFDLPFIEEQFKAEINNDVIDTLRMAKDTFPGLPSYKLSFLDQALHLGELEHHRAGNDIAITNALYLACKNPQSYWKYLTDKDSISRIQIEPKRKGYTQIDIHSIVPTDPSATPNTQLTGKCVVFSGVFSMPIEGAMQIAVDAGATLKSCVSKKVQYLVLGAQDLRFVDENGMTSKQRTATKLNKEGQANVEIIDEKTFLELSRTVKQ